MSASNIMDLWETGSVQLMRALPEDEPRKICRICADDVQKMCRINAEGVQNVCRRCADTAPPHCSPVASCYGLLCRDAPAVHLLSDSESDPVSDQPDSEHEASLARAAAMHSGSEQSDSDSDAAIKEAPPARITRCAPTLDRLVVVAHTRKVVVMESWLAGQ